LLGDEAIDLARPGIALQYALLRAGRPVGVLQMVEQRNIWISGALVSVLVLTLLLAAMELVGIL
jgi:hypothetical protein